ncbi:solute carrier family 23 protein [Streptomyces sp. NPDC050085]|uniref:solute carrier family 23 protein n=1 Tax=Streptomyces sp. NPDC050085 TaxID=3365600 RepID=UPI0037B41047
MAIRPTAAIGIDGGVSMARVDQNQRRRRGTGLIALDEDAAYGGYTLFAPLTGTGEVYLIDLRGEVVHRWNLPHRPGRHARILPNGNLAYSGVLPDEPALFPMWHKYRGGLMQEITPDGTVVREHRDPLQHHDAHHHGELAAVPLLVFALSSLAEATGQTILNSETVGRTPDPGRDVPRIVRADALVSLGSGIFGTSLMVTSAENIGIVRLTGVRSRFVTAAAGLLLVVCGLLGPLPRVLAAVPQPAVGAAGLVIYAVIAVMGFGMLSRTDLDHGTDGIVVALALVAGLLPIVAPQMYAGLPPWARTLFGSGVAAGVIAAVVLSAVFRVHGPREPAVTTPRGRGAPPAAGSR